MSPKNNHIPSVQELELSFPFVKNDTLRANLAINLQYIFFLIQTEEENTLPGAVSYSLFKNIILYTTSIIEGILVYSFTVGLEKKAIDESRAMKSSTKFRDIKTIYKIDKSNQIIAGRKEKSYEKFTRRTSFVDVIQAAKTVKMIDTKLAGEINDLREKRNKIHLAGLEIVDDYYDRKEINKAFALTLKTLEVLDDFLEEIIT